MKNPCSNCEGILPGQLMRVSDDLRHCLLCGHEIIPLGPVYSEDKAFIRQSALEITAHLSTAHKDALSGGSGSDHDLNKMVFTQGQIVRAAVSLAKRLDKALGEQS